MDAARPASSAPRHAVVTIRRLWVGIALFVLCCAWPFQCYPGTRAARAGAAIEVGMTVEDVAQAMRGCRRWHGYTDAGGVAFARDDDRGDWLLWHPTALDNVELDRFATLRQTLDRIEADPVTFGRVTYVSGRWSFFFDDWDVEVRFDQRGRVSRPAETRHQG